MRAAQKSFFLLGIVAILVLVSGCSGLSGAGTTTGTGSAGPFTIGGTVSGLAGSGLVLEDNGKDTLPISKNGVFVFLTTINSGGSFAVTVTTQPSNPTQTCGVTGGSGSNIAANANAVTVSCTTNPVTAAIGGTVSGLAANSSVILQNNGGDSLTITGNGPFTFKTPVTGADIFAVTVNTQPINPNQICTVTGGSGTATADVTTVAVNCVLSFSIGGTVTGVVGNGLILLNSSDSEQLAISPANGNQAFTFKKLVPTGTPYTVSIFAQPTAPTQSCVVSAGTGSGTATAQVTSVAVVCAAVTFSLGGTVVGLVGEPPTSPTNVNLPVAANTFFLQNNTGNNQEITQNGPFTFATPVALNGAFNVSVFTNPPTQPQGCTTWDFKGVVTGNITDILIDCAHDDWTWIDGANISGTIAAPQYGSFPTTPPTTIPNPYTNTPGARDLAAGWTDSNGNLWLFGGLGWELSGKTPPDTLNDVMNDLWECQMFGDQCQWQLVHGYDPTAVGATTVGAITIANAQTEDQFGVFGGPGPVPGARWGAATWRDASGNLWLFGGQGNGSGTSGFLNDLWMYNIATNAWTAVGGSAAANQKGTATTPGGRWSPVYWTDNGGNFWLFGGFGYDGSGTLGLLNDLWEYQSGVWTLVSATSTANQNGVYGTQGTSAATNMPGGRQEAVGWADANGNLWLFGGEGEDSVGTNAGILNDLWVFNITSKQWTWVTGSTTANQTGDYGQLPVIGPPSTVNAAGTVGLTGTPGTFPGSRWASSAWTDAGGNFWLFGGWGLDSTGTNGNGFLNDLWVYTPATVATQAGTWSWVKGSNTGNAKGQYGALTRPYLTFVNWTPGGRRGATSWVDRNGQLWLFGGQGYDSTGTNGNGYLNDLWRYLPFQD